jgi:hypothetical protein
MLIRLNQAEMLQAAAVAVMRQLDAADQKRKERYGTPYRSDLSVHVDGCCAELAVAKSLGMYWDGYSKTPSKLKGDVGQWQVRSTCHEGGCLIAHEQDRDETVFVLVVGSAPNLRIAGWIRGIDAKQKRFVRDGDSKKKRFEQGTKKDESKDESKVRVAYFVPQRELWDWDRRPFDPVDERVRREIMQMNG